MPFDAQLAIANLDVHGCGYYDHPDLTVLRARYPELGFVFDRIEELQESADTVDEQIDEAVKDEVTPLNEEIEELETRNSDLRLALNQIRELTVDVEITNIIEDAL